MPFLLWKMRCRTLLTPWGRIVTQEELLQLGMMPARSLLPFLCPLATTLLNLLLEDLLYIMLPTSSLLVRLGTCLLFSAMHQVLF